MNGHSKKRRPRQPPHSTGAKDETQTRARLLEAAVAVFAEEGFRAATVRRICDLARANVAAVSYHFGSKRGLYGAVIESLFHLREASGGALTATLEQMKGSPEEQLEVLICNQLKVIYGGPQDEAEQRASLLLKEYAFPSAELKRVVQNQLAPVVRYLTGLFRKILDAPDGDPRLDVAMSCVMGPMLFRVLTAPALSHAGLKPGRMDPKYLAEALTRFVMAGVRVLEKAPRRSR